MENRFEASLLEINSNKHRYTYELSLDRFIYIDSEINNALVRRLAPDILRLKQQSSEPITVGIDSPGGDLRALESLLGLLRSPDQHERACKIYTVAINQAMSAAATLLSLGDYSVAFQHSTILFHPVRFDPVIFQRSYGDLTAERALESAAALQRDDYYFAFKVASKALRRLVLVYSDQKQRSCFEDAKERYIERSEYLQGVFKNVLASHGCDDPDIYDFDLAGFVLNLWAKLSPGVDDQIIWRAVENLRRIAQVKTLVKHLSKGHSESADSASSLCLVRGSLESAFEEALKLFRPDSKKEGSSSSKKLDELERLVAIYLHYSIEKDDLIAVNRLLPELAKEVQLLEFLSDSEEDACLKWLMDDAIRVFLTPDSLKHFNELDKDEKDLVKQKFIYPQCEVFWLFVIMFCRRLFSEENYLTAQDAQLLGLIDEIPGGNLVYSKNQIEHMQVESIRRTYQWLDGAEPSIK